MKKIFAFCNQKGGVGKTTSAVNLAVILAMREKKILLVDVDPQGNATSGLGIEKPTSIESTSYQLFVDNPEKVEPRTLEIKNLSIIPANYDLSGAELELVNQERREFILKNHLETMRNDYDFIFIDCPPSLGLITINALVAADYIIIPLQCEYYALEGLGQLLHTYNLIKQNLNPSLEIGGVILTMADFRTNLTQQVIEEVKNYFQSVAFSSVIPRSVKISEAPSFGKPVVIYDAASKGAEAYFKLGEEFLARFSEMQPAFEGSKEIKPEAPISRSAEENLSRNIITNNDNK